MLVLALGAFVAAIFVLSDHIGTVVALAGVALVLLGNGAAAAARHETQMMALSNITRQLHWQNAGKHGDEVGEPPKPVRKAAGE